MFSLFKNALQRKLRQRVHVTPKVGYDVSGVLLHCDRSESGYLVLADAVTYLPDNAEERLPGEQYVPNVNVALVQIVPADVNG